MVASILPQNGISLCRKSWQYTKRFIMYRDWMPTGPVYTGEHSLQTFLWLPINGKKLAGTLFRARAKTGPVCKVTLT